MLTQHVYETLDIKIWEPKIKECCDKENPDNPAGCDCCYDNWQIELKDVKVKYSQSEEKARQLKDELTIVSDRRDRLKKWYDELTTANDLAGKICDQLDVFLTQTGKVATNTDLAIQAIKTLYCMIRDFYMQVDLIKTKYDRLINCIKCLNNPAFGAGQGIMKCLEEYGKKTDAVIATRDELVKQLMTVISIACRINHNIAPAFGLTTVLTDWKTVFNCGVGCDDTTEPPCPPPTGHGATGKAAATRQQEEETPDSCLGACNLVPVLLFPICKDPYYKCVDDQYKADKKAAEDLNKDLLKENKKKEALLACKQSLESAIKEVDPKNRCK